MHKDFGALLYGDDTKPVRDNLKIPSVSRDAGDITIGELAREAGVTSRALRATAPPGFSVARIAPALH
jgi:hypothetical protein